MEKILTYQHEQAINVSFCKNIVNLNSRKYGRKIIIMDLGNTDSRTW